MQSRAWRILVALVVLTLASTANASLGDRLPEFKECLTVCYCAQLKELTANLLQACQDVNCHDDPTPIRKVYRRKRRTSKSDTHQPYTTASSFGTALQNATILASIL